MTYKEALDFGISHLQSAQIEEADIDAWYLLEHITKIDKTWFLLNKTVEISDGIMKEYKRVLEIRKSRVPLQHITGYQEFMGYSFKVDENVLIPRQDTEVLVEEVCKIIDNRRLVLDMCTGSGCIIISLKKLNSSISAKAADLSEKALHIARENAKLNEADVEFIKSDLFNNIEGKFDIIVSNPPYIPTKVIEELMPEVREHEPIMALDGTEDGLLYYRKIVNASKEHLNEKGYLCFEIGHDQGQAVSEIMKRNGFYDIKVIKDLSGLDRVVTGYLAK